MSESVSTYIVVQPTTPITIGPEATVIGAAPFIEPIKSLFGPLAWLNTCSE
ncbi:MAG TPA: hypothetical protein VFA10_00585 [Ktedonobacteraceae bacterium]|nr:hypothetical protein [Ktedonobacteraceae bacterium]